MWLEPNICVMKNISAFVSDASNSSYNTRKYLPIGLNVLNCFDIQPPKWSYRNGRRVLVYTAQSTSFTCFFSKMYCFHNLPWKFIRCTWKTICKTLLSKWVISHRYLFPHLRLPDWWLMCIVGAIDLCNWGAWSITLPGKYVTNHEYSTFILEIYPY